MTADQEKALHDDFLAWSGGQPPDSPFEILTYCELTLPIEFDQVESRLALKRWMEKAWQEDPEIASPKDAFRVFLP